MGADSQNQTTAPNCPSCSAPWDDRNIQVWDVDGRDQCEDGRFEPPTFSMKIQCRSCGVAWFRGEYMHSNYGEDYDNE